MLYKVVLTFESLDEILNSDNQMEAIEKCFFIMVLFPFKYFTTLNLDFTFLKFELGPY